VISAVISSPYRYSSSSVEISIAISGSSLSATQEVISAAGAHSHLPMDSRSSLSVASSHFSLISSLSHTSPVISTIVAIASPVSSSLSMISSMTDPSPSKSVSLIVNEPAENSGSSQSIVCVSSSVHVTSLHVAIGTAASRIRHRKIDCFFIIQLTSGFLRINVVVGCTSLNPYMLAFCYLIGNHSKYSKD